MMLLSLYVDTIDFSMTEQLRNSAGKLEQVYWLFFLVSVCQLYDLVSEYIITYYKNLIGLH